MPLTQEQFTAARNAGFTTEQIIGFEKQRASEPTSESIPTQSISDIAKTVNPTSFMPNFSMTAPVGDESTITPTDIMTGMTPYKAIRGMGEKISKVGVPIMKQVPILNKIPFGARLAGDPNAILDVMSSLPVANEALTPIKAVAKSTSNNMFRGGLPKGEATRIASEYGDSTATLVDKIKARLTLKKSEADLAYKTATDNFKGKVNGEEFFNKIQKGLRDKGFIDLQGNPTGRYAQNLDPTYKELTDIYSDMKNVGKLKGQPLTKEDFYLYRDKLGRMLKDRPSDRLVMEVRNSLYDSAEKSGMKGIKNARNLEKQAFEKESQFLNSNTGDLKVATEQKLSRIGTDKPLSKQELDHIRELENYVGHPITRDATNINKLNKSRQTIQNIKKYGKYVAGGAIAGEVGRKVATGNF